MDLKPRGQVRLSCWRVRRWYISQARRKVESLVTIRCSLTPACAGAAHKSAVLTLGPASLHRKVSVTPCRLRESVLAGTEINSLRVSHHGHVCASVASSFTCRAAGEGRTQRTDSLGNRAASSEWSQAMQPSQIKLCLWLFLTGAACGS